MPQITETQLQALKQAGFSQPEIEKYGQQLGFQVPTPKLSQGYLAGVARNAPKSLGNFVGDTVKGVANIINPNMEKNTVANLVKLTTGIVGALMPGEQKNEEYAKQLANYYVDRYGGFDNIVNTFYNDPVGLIDDAAMVLSAGGTAATKAGKLSKFGKLAEVGQDISRLGNTLDPIQAIGRGVGKGMDLASEAGSGIFKSAGNQLTGLSDELSMRSLRPSPSQQRKFQDLTGKSIPEYRRSINQFGGAEDTLSQQSGRIKKASGAYNNLVRTGEIVDPTPYINELRQKANEIIQSNFSQEAQRVADDLSRRADILETKALQYMEANGTNGIPIDIITETKSSSFSKVPQGAMMDQSALLGSKEAGGIGVGVLEDLAPGSQKIGKQLQADILLQNIAKQQSGLGKGTQVLNAFKPVGYGSGLGGMLGGLQGAITGGIVASTINNPKVLGNISKGAYNLGNKLKSGKLPKVNIPSSVGNAYQTTRPARAFERASSGVRSNQSREPMPMGGKQQQLGAGSQAILSEIERNKKKNPFYKL